MAALRAVLAQAKLAFDATLRAYACLLFSRSRVTGALVLGATAIAPRALVFGLLALATASLTARAFGLVRGAIGDGSYGYNAILVGLGVAHGFDLDLPAAALTVGAAVTCVFVTAAICSSTARLSGAPVLSLPFIATQWLVDGAASHLALTPVAPPASGALFSLDPSPGGVLEVFGALVFQPNPIVGAFVLAALLVHSRIAALLAGLAIGVAALFASVSPYGQPGGIESSFALNAFLTAIALGGVWFIPSRSSFALAALGSVVACLITAAIAHPLGTLGLAPLILPFNVSVILVLFATRERARDANPKSVDFAPGSPEENLAYVQTRLARFQALYAVEIHLPFRGAWVCTQGVDGKHTHKGQWRHAFDFEVEVDQVAYRGEGTTVGDHYCHGLPVLAAADGTVVHVENGVPDNRIGGMELRQNWGNAVVLYHAPGLYSVVAHLVPGSASVMVGQGVRRGDVLGLCGNSGRSPRPHLHFQLQGEPRLGAPTLPCRFSDAVSIARDNGESLRLTTIPRERQTLRNVDPDDMLASYFDFPLGVPMEFRVGRVFERVEYAIDLYGQRTFKSTEHGTTLYFSRTDRAFMVLDVLGGRRSLLHAVRSALGRVPFDGASSLRWIDSLPARANGSPLMKPLRDFIAPFVGHSGLEMVYQATRDGDELEILGRSRRERFGKPLVTTQARLVRGYGIVFVEVRERGHVVRAERVDERDAEAEAPVSSDRPVRRLEWPRDSAHVLEPLRSQTGE